MSAHLNVRALNMLIQCCCYFFLFSLCLFGKSLRIEERQDEMPRRNGELKNGFIELKSTKKTAFAVGQFKNIKKYTHTFGTASISFSLAKIRKKKKFKCGNQLLIPNAQTTQTNYRRNSISHKCGANKISRET